MKQLTAEQFFEFEKKFNNNEFPHQRYGQAFCNHFNIEGASKFFYEEDYKMARVSAWFYFLKVEDEDDNSSL